MGQNITIGQYYPADSVIHRLDPRVKIIGTLVYLVSVFLFRNYGFFLGTAVLAALILLSKVPFRMMLRGMKPVLVILIFTGILNILLTPGEVLWQWKALKVTREGLVIAGLTSIRLIYLVIGASIMTLTTTPNKLTDAMEHLMRPLKAFRVPVHEIAMMMSIALRFIPILTGETDRIKKAQMARGADFESGGLIQRVRAMIPLLVPLFVSAFRRANDLALAMEARCYHGGEGRTQMKPLHYTGKDYTAYGLIAAYLVVAIVMRAAFHL